MKQEFGVALKGFYLLLPQSFLISNDILLTFIHLAALLLVLEALFGRLQLLLSEAISLDKLPIEAALLLLVHHIIGVVVDVLVLLDLLGVVDDHVGLEVEL